MTYERDTFKQWESELDGGELIGIQDTLTFAQELQLGISQLPYDDRNAAGFEALRLIGGMPQDIRHKKFAMRALRAYAFLENIDPQTHQQNALKFGAMHVSGQVGFYAFSHSIQESTINLQLFEPRQFSVVNPDVDTIKERLPVPLSIPVLAIENLVQLK